MKLQIQFIIIIIATLGGLVRRRDLATLFEDSAREFEGMLIGKNALRHYVGGKEAGKVNS